MVKAMPEYVYALHDFVPEHQDEISFGAHERIEVIEKDDLYGDGWWKGRNLAGKSGLFPQSYTAPAPPALESLAHASSSSSTITPGDGLQDSSFESSKTVLQPLHEEPEAVSPSVYNIAMPTPIVPSVVFNGHYAESTGDNDEGIALNGDGEVMKATMTDVQKAIEQLGRGRGAQDIDDGTRSFSFASTRDDRDTEGDTDDTDLSDKDGEGWHKGARRKLAENARKAIEEAERLEMMSGSNGIDRRMTAPPIEVELSDESDDEGDHEGYTNHSSVFPRIPEEDEGGAETDVEKNHHGEGISNATTTKVQTPTTAHPFDNQATHIPVPERDESALQTATATKSSFPVFHAPQFLQDETVSAKTVQGIKEREARSGLPTPISPNTSGPADIITVAIPSPRRLSLQLQQDSMPGMQSPTSIRSKHNSAASASSMGRMASTFTGAPVQIPTPARTSPSPFQPTPTSDRKDKAPPSEWTVEDVVDWLRGKGFDSDVCNKFTEQEITGDVLLELDVNLLKTEIGILAFGKRVRIANAITDLRRPPSIVYSDNPEPSPSSFLMPTQSPMFPVPPAQPSHFQFQQQQQGLTHQQSAAAFHTHSRSPSQSQSHHSFPGAGVGHAYSQSIQSSLGSPLGYPGYAMTGQFGGNGVPGSGTRPGSPMYGGEFAGNGNGNGHAVRVGESEGSGSASAVPGDESTTSVAQSGVGLGIEIPAVNGKGSKGRPAQLMLSPSDGALKDSAKAVSNIPEEGEDERGHMSEGEIAPASTSMRRRLFGRSHDSASTKERGDSASRHSRDGASSAVTTPSVTGESHGMEKEKEKEKEKAKDKGEDGASMYSRTARSKKNGDSVKSSSGDRLSIFGGTFAVKTRKPPPRYSSVSEDGQLANDKGSKFSIGRLNGGVARKTSSSNGHRPSTPVGSPNLSPKDAIAIAASPQKDKSKEAHEKAKEVKDKPKEGKEKHKEVKEKSKARESKVQDIVVPPRDSSALRKRTVSSPNAYSSETPKAGNDSAKLGNGLDSPLKPGMSIIDQIGTPDYNGWMRKRQDRYNSWKLRYFLLKGPHLYCLKSSSKMEARIKGYINIVGYKVTVDENVDPGRYGFRIDHDHDKTHYFSSDEKTIIRDWMKAIMKATIGRDYTKPVVSSCNIPTIPLMVAQAMNPPPRPPSPTARDATQKALRRENPDQLSSRDARVLMGLPSSTDNKDGRAPLDSFFTTTEPLDMQDDDASLILGAGKSSAPPRPSREMRRLSSLRAVATPLDDGLVEWANSHLPESLQIKDSNGPLCTGLALLRLAESIKGRPCSPPVPDSAFPTDPSDEKLDGLFKLFDFLLDNDVKMGSVSINDVRQEKRDKIIQLLRALKAWEDKKKAIAQSIGKGSMQAGGFIAPVGLQWGYA